jgi:hypothetical protein
LKTLLEKAIVCLLNGDEEKAAGLFHKFMVERARQIHESLRQNDGSEDSLNEDWDSEIKEEEYFGDDELADEPTDGVNSPINGSEDMPPADDMDNAPVDAMAGGDDDASMDDMADMGDDDMGDSMDGEEAPGVEGKIDELTDKIDELTAEFDRVMAEFQGDEPGDDSLGDDEPMDDMGGDEPVDGDMGGENFGEDDLADSDDDSDLADRMEDDMGDDETAPDHQMAEGKLPPWLKKDGKDKSSKGKDWDKKEKVEECGDEEMDESEDMGDDDLSDITESVLAELDKIAYPLGTTEHKGIGANTAPSNITSAGQKSPIPHHNVMDRIKGEPVMTKGPTHKGYARETPPTTRGHEALVKNVRKGNQRNSYKDTMETVPANGPSDSLLHKDFAGGPKPTKSIVDGKTHKG